MLPERTSKKDKIANEKNSSSVLIVSKTGNMITKPPFQEKAALRSPVKVSLSKSRVPSFPSSSSSPEGGVTSPGALLGPSAMNAGSLPLSELQLLLSSCM